MFTCPAFTCEERHVCVANIANISSRCSDKLDQTKITGNKDVDNIQDSVNEGVSGQLGKGGLLNPVGEQSSKEVFTRSERGGKGENGGIK